MLKNESESENLVISWRWLDMAFYLSCAIGLLSTVLPASHLTLPGFLIVSIGTILCMGTYYFLDKVHEKFHGLLLFGMSALSVLIIVCLWIISMSIQIIVSRGFFFNGQIILCVPYIFVFAFASVVRQLEQAYSRMRELVSNAAVSHRELEKAHLQLRHYAEHIEELAATQERNRIAREIHDSLGHYLTLLAVQLETAISLEERGAASLHTELEEAKRVAKTCLSEVRSSVSALRPEASGATSLKERLRHLVSEFEMVTKESRVALDLEEARHEPGPEQRATLYRCAQEALTNIGKHAQASKVLLRLCINEEQAELTVLDNGQGGKVRDLLPGFGLTGMRERVELLGGTAYAGAEPGRGWRVEVKLPLPLVSVPSSSDGKRQGER